jgi:hypothetical protein
MTGRRHFSFRPPLSAPCGIIVTVTVTVTVTTSAQTLSRAHTHPHVRRPSQVAKACGAFVIATASSAEKLAVARHHGGADVAISYLDEGWVAHVKKVLGKRIVDVVFDPVGLPLASTKLMGCGPCPDCCHPYSQPPVPSLRGLHTGSIHMYQPETCSMKRR